MAKWDEMLHEASFDGIEFPVSTRRLRGGRALARRRYPNRPGQNVEDTGREPYGFEIEAPFFNGIDPELYPGRWDQLRFALDSTDTLGEAEYVDPFLGAIQAKVITWDFLEDAARRDGGILTLKLEEVSFDDVVFTVTDATDPQRLAENQAAELDESLAADLGVDEADLEQDFEDAGVPLTEDEKDKPAGTLWATQVTRFSEGLEDGVQSSLDVAARVDTLRARINVLMARDEVQQPAGAYAMHAATRLASALTDVGARAVKDVPPLVEHVTKTVQSVYEISTEAFGTPDRAEEILQRNPTATPLMIPAGTRLVLLAA